MTIILEGCSPAPMASYLKALGLFRLVAQQKDASCQGWWGGGHLHLKTALTKEELIAFLVDEYAPTPLVAPWNGGSGFNPDDKLDGILAIQKSKDPRFATYQAVINEIKSWPESPTVPETAGEIRAVLAKATNEFKGRKQEDLAAVLAEMDRTLPPGATWETALAEVEAHPKDRSNPEQDAWRNWWKAVKKGRTRATGLARGASKEALLNICRSRLPETALEWIDAAFALGRDGKPDYNPVLGTGGNEGRLDFTNNFMQRLAELLLGGKREETVALARAALFGEITDGLAKASIGQYDPGRAGGFNQGMEVETKDFKINPWDFVLMLEGSLVLAGSMVRRSPVDPQAQLASPFTVRFSPVGFSSGEAGEQGRAETWLPVWERPASLAEVKHLFGEGRASLQRRQARTGLEFSRSVGSLGVDRGIKGFQRYVYLQRRGQSYVALPAGSIPVRYSPILELLNDLDRLLQPLDRFLRGFENPPASFTSVRRKIDEAIFTCTQKPEPASFHALLRVLGRMDRLVAMRDRSKKPKLLKPPMGLSPGWLAACDDGRLEIRVAAALASIGRSGKIGPLASYLVGVSAEQPWQWDSGEGKKCWTGNSMEERLGNVVLRRLLDAERYGVDEPPFRGRLGLAPQDIGLFLQGACDPVVLEELLWGLMMLEWRLGGLDKTRLAWSRPVQATVLPRQWCLLKLLHLPAPVQGVKIRREPRIARLLSAGRVEEACQVAMYRLRASNLSPYQAAYLGRLEPARLLASLLIPVRMQARLERAVLQQPKQ